MICLYKVSGVMFVAEARRAGLEAEAEDQSDVAGRVGPGRAVPASIFARHGPANEYN